MQRILRALLCIFLLFPFLAYGYVEEYSDEGMDSSFEQFNYENEDKYSRYETQDDSGYYETENEEKYSNPRRHHRKQAARHHKVEESSRFAASISPPGEKLIIVDPQVHGWGAYDADGMLVREGLASAGSRWCEDLGRSCRTQVGTFRIISLGSSKCFSRKFPLGRGGAPMPYCMYFNRSQALHGSNEVVEGNVSHGCVRISVSDAEWLRFNFTNIGTKVIIRSY